MAQLWRCKKAATSYEEKQNKKKEEQRGKDQKPAQRHLPPSDPQQLTAGSNSERSTHGGKRKQLRLPLLPTTSTSLPLFAAAVKSTSKKKKQRDFQ
jgi:hypothetical protein